jgi:hypothetical protein
MGLTVVGAVLLITGLLMVLVGEALGLKSGHGGPGIARTGELVAICGLGIGVALLVGLMVGRTDRARADSAHAERSRADRGSRSRRRRAAGAGPGRWRDPAQEWLGPMHTTGAGLVPLRVPAPWPEQAAQSRPGAHDYADDGWHPDTGDGWHPDTGDGWSPGPAYVWSPGQEDDRDRGGDEDWNPGGGEDWSLAGTAGATAWPSDDLHRPEGTGQEPGHATGSRHGRVTGPHAYPSAPALGYVTGPQPAYAYGPEPGHGTDPAPAYASDPDAGRLADPEGGYLAAGPAYLDAQRSGASEPDRTREDDDTSPVPVIRGPGQPAPESFSVWEPAPKPSPERGRDSRSDDVYRPAHAEPPSTNTQEKIEQIKDLYLTAEAIGEDALGKHFDQLRQRQHSLIREFFEKAGLGSKDTPGLLGDDSAQDGASLPG